MFNNFDERLYFENEMMPRIYGKKRGLFRISSRHCVNFSGLSRKMPGLTVGHLLEEMEKGKERKLHPFAFIQVVENLDGGEEFFQCESITTDEVLALKEGVDYMKANQGVPLIEILQFQPHWRELLFLVHIAQAFSEFRPEIYAKPLPNPFSARDMKICTGRVQFEMYEEAVRSLEIEIAKEGYSEKERQSLMALKYAYNGLINDVIYLKVTGKKASPASAKTLGSTLVAEGKKLAKKAGISILPRPEAKTING